MKESAKEKYKPKTKEKNKEESFKAFQDSLRLNVFNKPKILE